MRVLARSQNLWLYALLAGACRWDYQCMRWFGAAALVATFVMAIFAFRGTAVSPWMAAAAFVFLSSQSYFVAVSTVR